MEGPLLSVISVNWNRKEELSRMLSSLQKQTYKRVEFIVVDNASSDGSVRMLREDFPKVKIVEMPANIGLFAAFNRGVKEAEGEIIFGIDNDCIVRDDELLYKIVEKFRNPELGIVACLIKDFSTGKDLPNSPSRLPSGDPQTGYDCLQFSGCAFAIRKNLFENVGGFQEDYVIYAGEIELAMKCIDAGAACKFFPDIIVYHARSEKSRSRLYDYYTVRNTLWWYWQYFPIYDLIKRGLGFGTIAKNMVTGAIAVNLHSIRGLMDAILSFPKIIRRRTPFSNKTMQHFYRVVREHKSVSSNYSYLK
jgi:hypothetical protein